MSDNFFKEDIRNFMGIDVSYYENIDETDLAIIFIVHGLAEHSARYVKLGKSLKENGYGCAAVDLPGHGKTAGEPDKCGEWPKNGFDFCIETVNKGIEQLIEKYKKPIILLGHSMGSFISLGYIEKYGHKIKGCILSGTNDMQPSALLVAGKIVASIQSALKGSTHKSKLLDSMSFGSFNGHFKPNRTNFDWLSKDEKEVDKYVDDPYCGFISSVGLFKSFLSGLSSIYKENLISAIPNDLPIFIFAGGKDPVGNFGKGPLALGERLKSSGLLKINTKIYENARHECINELNNDEVLENVIEFCGS